MTSDRRTAALLVLSLAAPTACTSEPDAVGELVWELRDGEGSALPRWGLAVR